NRPTRIGKDEFGRPKQLPRVKPKRAAREENPLWQAHRKKSALRALMVTLPPDAEQPHANTQRDKRKHLREPPDIDRLFLEPQNQEQRCRQRARGALTKKCQRIEDQS